VPFQLLITHLPSTATYETIFDLFRTFGQITSCVVDLDGSGQPIGTANIAFLCRSDAIFAYRQINGYKVNNHPIVVSLNFALEGADLGGTSK
jgi:RNA recognition motif-containing protein